MKKTSLIVISAFIGLLVGYPVSYFFQPGALRMKLPLQGYVEHIGDVLSNKDLAGTAIGTWVGCVVVMALLGWVLAAAVSSKDPKQ